MKNRFIFLFAAVLTIVSACGPVRYSSSFNLKGVDEYALFEPFSHVIYYNERNNPKYDPDLSDEAARVLLEVIESERYPFTHAIQMDYDDSDVAIARWLDSFADMGTYSAGRLRVPDALVQKIKQSKHRYGILFYSYGHIQSAEGRRLEEMERATVQMIEKIADAIADRKRKSNPTYIPRTEPYNNTIYYVIIDSQTGQIADLALNNSFFYSNPVNASDVRENLAGLLKEMIQ